MTSPTTAKAYCPTCRRSISSAWWARHLTSIGHVRRAHGDPPPYYRPAPSQPDVGDSEKPDNDDVLADVDAPATPAKPLGPCISGTCENRRIGGTGPQRLYFPNHAYFARPNPPTGSEPAAYLDSTAADAHADEEDASTVENGEEAKKRPIARVLREREEAKARTEAAR